MAHALSNIAFTLNHELPQFTKGKTEKTMMEIAKQYIINSNSSKRKIDIIITNNSIQENLQWTSRLDVKFKDSHINIKTLSSAKTSDFKTIHEFITQIVKSINLNDYTKFPHILVICCHKTRVDKDMQILLSSFCNNNNIEINIRFDEADASLKIIQNFLQMISETTSDLHKIINSVEFITATPLEDFWKMLSQQSIHMLQKSEKVLEEVNELSETSHIHKEIDYNKLFEMFEVRSETNYDVLFNNYRELEDHIWINHENDTNDPVQYAKDCFLNCIANNHTQSRNIIFCPSHNFKSQHEEIANFFKEHNYTTFLHNGQFKGFRYPDPDKQDESLDKYNARYKDELKDPNKSENSIELRDTLRHWSLNNPKSNLVITGKLTVTRGITFNTNDFNFTHAIISNYHAKSLKELIQLLGRCNGNKEYVNQMFILSTNETEKLAKETVQTIKEITLLQPEYYNQSDFDHKNKNAIPVKLTFNNIHFRDELVSLIQGTKKKGKHTLVHNKLVEGLKSSSILIEDNNNIKFDINTRILKTIRCFDEGNKPSVRRFDKFQDNFEKRHGYGQSIEENTYCIDMAIIDWKYNEYINDKNTAWISFKK
jgi:hypothetical protein